MFNFLSLNYCSCTCQQQIKCVQTCYPANVSCISIQRNFLGKDKKDTQATYRQDDIRCRNWIPPTFMPYSILQITSIRFQLVAMVVLWQCKVWVYVVRQSLCCTNLKTTKQIQHILNISYRCNTVFQTLAHEVDMHVCYLFLYLLTCWVYNTTT